MKCSSEVSFKKVFIKSFIAMLLVSKYAVVARRSLDVVMRSVTTLASLVSWLQPRRLS